MSKEDRKFIEIVAFKPAIMKADFKPIKEEIKKKLPQNAQQAAVWMWRKMKNRVRKTRADKVIPVEYSLYRWQGGDKWEKFRKSPVEWMAGKRSVTLNQGHGVKHSRIKEVKNQGIRHWNKASKPGEGPISHQTDMPGWNPGKKTGWLHSNIYWEVDGDGWIRVYVDEGNGAKDTRRILHALEYGGMSTPNRKMWITGYDVMTIRNGYRTERGDGKQYGRKNHSGKAKRNKSGETRRAHKRQFKQPHVQLRYHWEYYDKGNMTIAARPFVAPVRDAFFRDFFPELYGAIMQVEHF